MPSLVWFYAYSNNNFNDNDDTVGIYRLKFSFMMKYQLAAIFF